MDKFLEACNFPKLNHGGIENVDRPVTSKKKHVSDSKQKQNLSTNKSPEPDSFTSEAYQRFKENFIQSSLSISRTLLPELSLDIPKSTHTQTPYIKWMSFI